MHGAEGATAGDAALSPDEALAQSILGLRAFPAHLGALMELIDGGTLAQRLATSGPFRMGELRRVAIELLGADGTRAEVESADAVWLDERGEPVSPAARAQAEDGLLVLARDQATAIGMVVAHYVPFRAIRAGHQLSDSKGASAALSAEVAVMCGRRALAGFLGPRDVFRNPLAIYRLNQPCPDGQSPFDLELGVSGDAFAIHSMHFKLGLYEHQSAGALQAIVDACVAQPDAVRDLNFIRAIRVKIYEPAYSIIADPAKRTPTTRQSADHSLPFILAKTLLKAHHAVTAGQTAGWESLMLLPEDYSDAAISDREVQSLIDRISIEHGGREYDALYPDGIPTSVAIEHASLGLLGGGLVQYPLGHARSDAAGTAAVVALKFDRLVAGAVDDPRRLRERIKVAGRSPQEIAELYAFPIHGCDPG
jgi:2-methylcitrate dehydratase